jgi:hypothetical protein
MFNAETEQLNGRAAMVGVAQVHPGLTALDFNAFKLKYHEALSKFALDSIWRPYTMVGVASLILFETVQGYALF